MSALNHSKSIVNSLNGAQAQQCTSFDKMANELRLEIQEISASDLALAAGGDQMVGWG
jgi:hypothetical protein